MDKYPEHEKMTAAHDKAMVIGDFIDWLKSESPYVIAGWETKRPCEAESWNKILYHGPVWRCVGGRMMGGDEYDYDMGECSKCSGKGYTTPVDPVLLQSNVSTLNLLAKYLDIDLDEIEIEKRAMLDEIQKGNREG